MTNIKHFFVGFLFVGILFSSISTAKGQIAFEEVSSNDSGFTYIGESWGLSWGDFNGDGYPDLWTSNHSTKPSLYLNNIGNSDSIPTDGLLSHYDFEEGSGLVAGDLSGNGNDGIINGGAAWIASANEKGGGLEFNGVDSYVDIGDRDLTDAFSIGAWIKISSLGKHMIIGKTFQTYQLYVSSEGKIIFQRNAATPISYNAGLVPDTWYHVAVTFDTTNGISLYLDGVLVSTNGDITVTNQNNVRTKIGAAGSTAQNFFSGAIDEVRIYNRALTSQEVEFISTPGTIFRNIIDLVWSDESWEDTHGAQWIDYDNDGDQDLSEQIGNPNYPGHHLFINDSGVLTDQAEALGIVNTGKYGRNPLWFDYDNDRRLDALLPSGHSRVSNLYRNTGAGFVKVNSTVGLDITPPCWGAQLADLNGDGILDLLPTYLPFPPPEIYDMTTIPFTDIRNTFNVSNTSETRDLAIADFNNDTLIDVFAVTNKKYSKVVQQDSTLVEMAFKTENWGEHGITFSATGNTLTFKVYNGFYGEEFVFIGSDGHQPSDLALVGRDRYAFTVPMNDSSSNGMKSHNKRGLYIGFNTDTQLWEVTNVSNGRIPLEIIMESDGSISNITPVGFDPTEPQLGNALLMNDGTDLINRTAELGVDDNLLSTSVVAGDFDNDMDVDVYIVNSTVVENLPNVLYENMGDGSFIRVAGAGGAEGSMFGSGDHVAVADYDNDGFLDIAITNGNELGIFSDDGPTQLFRNTGNSNNWIQIDLEGTVSNRDGIGARVFATAGGIMQVRDQNGGMHNRTQNYKRIHFGMGSHTIIDKLEVYWSSGIVQTLNDVNVNQILHIVESEGTTGTPTPMPSVPATPTPLTSLSPTPVPTASPVATASPAVSPTPSTTPTATVSPAVSPAPTPTPDVNLIAYYAFEEGSGGVAVDSSGNGNDGVINGGAAWTTGANGIGGGLGFNGIDAFVDIGDIDLTDAFTIAAWIKSSVLGSKSTILGKAFQTYQLFISPQNSILFQSNSGTQLVYDAGLVVDTWHHIAVTFNTIDGMVLYVNGVAVAANSTTAILNTNNVLTKIGATGFIPKDFFQGTIDEVRIYSRSLAAEEVQDLSIFTVPSLTPTPVATSSPVVTPSPVVTASPTVTPN
ncbi:MAG: hypothetical protein E3K38_14035 [Candidatus Kuenenia stuttgartiensis]|nr:hypothetical protein [Candidatus Kuenenia stuttgartiensis]